MNVAVQVSTCVVTVSVTQGFLDLRANVGVALSENQILWQRVVNHRIMEILPLFPTAAVEEVAYVMQRVTAVHLLVKKKIIKESEKKLMGYYFLKSGRKVWGDYCEW